MFYLTYSVLRVEYLVSSTEELAPDQRFTGEVQVNLKSTPHEQDP